MCESLKNHLIFTYLTFSAFLSCLLTTELRSSWIELKTNISSGNSWRWLSKIVMNFWRLNKNKQKKYWDVSLWIAELEIFGEVSIEICQFFHFDSNYMKYVGNIHNHTRSLHNGGHPFHWRFSDPDMTHNNKSTQKGLAIWRFSFTSRSNVNEIIMRSNQFLFALCCVFVNDLMPRFKHYFRWISQLNNLLTIFFMNAEQIKIWFSGNKCRWKEVNSLIFIDQFRFQFSSRSNLSKGFSF